MVSAWPLQSGISDQVSKWLQIFLHLSSVTQFLGARYGNHKKLWPFANITSSSATSSEINYSRLSTFSQRWDFSCQQRGTVEVGTAFPVLKNQGISCPSKCADQKWEGETEKKWCRSRCTIQNISVELDIYLWCGKQRPRFLPRVKTDLDIGIHYLRFLFSSVESTIFRRKWQIRESASDQPLIFPPVTGYRK